MRRAQQTAFKKKKKVEVIWRNYTDTVEPTGPEFSTADLRGRLLLALRQILQIYQLQSFEEPEQSVGLQLLIVIDVEICIIVLHK